MTAVTDPVLFEAGLDNHQYQSFRFVNLKLSKGQVRVMATYQRHSRSPGPGDEIGTLKIRFLPLNEYRD